MSRNRYELALKSIKPSQWERFEAFASAFLISEYPNLRTMASSSGDRGRDAELFLPADDPDTVLQYSVTPNWDAKIRATAERLEEEKSAARLLVYVTNQQIGAKADALRSMIRKKYKRTLDILDQSYFLDRYEGDAHREVTFENLAKEIVDPFLVDQGVKRPTALTGDESRAALVFLELQWQDETKDKGLTKLAFEALVRSALRNSHSESRVAHSAILERVSTVLSALDANRVKANVDGALQRLERRGIVKHWAKENEYCLSHEEFSRLKERAAAAEVASLELKNECREIIQAVCGGAMPDEQMHDAVLAVQSIAEKYLLSKGEAFASALVDGRMGIFHGSALADLIDKEKFSGALNKALGARPNDKLHEAVRMLLTSAGPSVSRYLKSLSDAYTVFAFLRHTPDVQAATSKMFSTGEIFLDTGILLPLLAEDLVAEERRRFRNLIHAAKASGIKLLVIAGVIEELERHLNRCMACAGTPVQQWEGRTPFVYNYYLSCGRNPAEFREWLTRFMGTERPEDDLADYLREFFGIEVADIDSDVDAADVALRGAIKEIWTAIHTERRERYGRITDPLISIRLAEHDTTNYVGAIQRRRNQDTSAFGYTSWWLTLDHKAFEIKDRLSAYIDGKIPASPAMSADFLDTYLSIGPMRGTVARADASLALSFDFPQYADLTPELIELANRVRSQSASLPEHVIRRNVRDALDAARRRTGPITMNGLDVTIDAERS